MKVGSFTRHFTFSLIGALALASLVPSRALARHDDGHASTSQHHEGARDQKKANDLVKTVREATERFRDVAVADAEGYKLMFGCVSGGDSGAMGLHFVKGEYLDDVLDPTRPEIVIYEPTPSGRLKLVGADFLITAEAWHAKNPKTVPELGGQLLHLFEAPNRFGLPNFYTLHVWAWKENPTGMFVNWHQKISCENYSPQQ